MIDRTAATERATDRSSPTAGPRPRGAPAPLTAEVVVDRELRSSIRVLIVDDEHSLRESCASVLGAEGYQVSTARRGEEALMLVKRQRFDILLLDLYMPQVSGLELMRAALEHHPETIAIIMTGNPSVESNIEALRAGAWDYLAKPFSATQMQVTMGRAAHTVMVSRESSALREEAAEQHSLSTRMTILGASPAFHGVIDLARKVAATDASVFLAGESGTGKEMIAQFIHRHSRRASRPLVAVNCAALPESLLESEMFGHCKGAFTGADRDKPGLLEAANGGTLFLDELTEMPMVLQAKLLRVIQDGVVRRVGSSSTDTVVNVRFIAATNRNPEEATEEGLLRRDLYYRLRVVPIRIPPLRERPEDIPVLARHFLHHYWERHRGSERRVPELSEEAVRVLLQQPWEGNVRELQNLLEHAVVLADPGRDLGPRDLPLGDDPFRARTGASLADSMRDFHGEPYHAARDRLLAGFERAYVTWLVQHAAGNMSEAARVAGVDRTTLYRLMEKHGLDRSEILD